MHEREVVEPHRDRPSRTKSLGWLVCLLSEMGGEDPVAVARRHRCVFGFLHTRHLQALGLRDEFALAYEGHS